MFQKTLMPWVMLTYIYQKSPKCSLTACNYKKVNLEVNSGYDKDKKVFFTNGLLTEVFTYFGLYTSELSMWAFRMGKKVYKEKCVSLQLFITQPLWKIVWRLLTKTKNTNLKRHSPLFIAALFIIPKIRNQLRCPLIEEWIKM